MRTDEERAFRAGVTLALMALVLGLMLIGLGRRAALTAWQAGREQGFAAGWYVGFAYGAEKSETRDDARVSDE